MSASSARPARKGKTVHKTKIDYATHTWNPVWGCRRDCPYCYARATAERWGLPFEPHWREKNFNRAMPRDPGARIFVNSMSDIEWWEEEWWRRVMARIWENPQHTFLFLTKNPDAYNERVYPANCWLGVTATTQKSVARGAQINPASMNLIQFLSIEPILGRIDLEEIDPAIIDWIILGAETGNRAGRVIPQADWIAAFLDPRVHIPLFMKDNLPWDGERRREYPG